MTLLQAQLARDISAEGRPPHENDPIVAPEQTLSSMTSQICAPPLERTWPLWWKLSLAAALVFVFILVVAIGWLFYAGVGIWGIDWPVVWGFAILNYVWWIAIASGGTFISALFYLAEVEWRSALNRLAETITIFAAACAAIYPILHLGRPWLFYWLFPYPNVMGVWPQFRSPLLWDFVAILTYVVSSILFWYYGLVPDLATMRDKAGAQDKRRFYGVFALGFRGSQNAWRYYRIGYGLLAAAMAPLVISVHSIVGLDFAGAATVGWHSTEFPPFFVFGALLSGFATVMLLAIPVRRLLRLEDFITGRHFDILGKLLLTSSLCVGYAYLMEAFTVFYGPDAAEKRLFIDKLTGELAPVYWATILFNVVAPQSMWRRSVRLNETLVVLISLFVIVGMWCERYVIVVMSLRRTHLPSAWGGYTPTIWDWLTLFGTVGLFIAGLLIAIRLLPVISMFEMREVILRNARPEK
ncbi:NrfD/PsrC family molybdoenzyme membrane anchor subunit [Methylocystis sp. B8]|uniref:NrfD/PsrC family molybdoenzyme membrane anchor subunit n=1 Tax=Methylocystis sp. B8 TaxID=544938 RepID=UPI0010FDB047|nr:NrfD/PsrC family molybdoenzyme membrane anchor subunit [Methylocystis sp. B8]TLG73701.1 hydrogenase [Methylocystis sp. B8]